MANPILRLNIDNNKIVVKQDTFPVQVTGNSYYQFTGVTPTIVTDTQVGNLHTISVFSPSGLSGQDGKDGAIQYLFVGSGGTSVTETSGHTVTIFTAPTTHYALASSLNAHTGDTTIHFKQNQIAIAESQVTNLVTDLAAKATKTSLASHTGNTNIHFTQGAIQIAESQVTNLTSDLAGKSPTSHLHTGVYAPVVHTHSQYSLTGHTHTIANVIGLQTALNNKSNTGHTHSQYLTASALNPYWTSGQTQNAINIATTGLTSAWSGITGNPTGSTSLMALLADYVDYVTYNFNNNILSQQLQDVDNQLAWLSGNTIQSLAGYWNSGQTVNYINGRNFLTGVTWNIIAGNPTGSTSLMQLFADYVDFTTYNFNNNILSQDLQAITGSISSHTGNTAIHFTQGAIQIAESQVTNLTSDLAGKSPTGHTHSQYATVTNLTGHTSNAAIHFTQGAIQIAESQVTNLVGKYSPTGHTHSQYALQSGINTYTGTTAPAAFAPFTPSIVSLTGNTTLNATHENKIMECNGTFTVTFPNSMVTGCRYDIVNIGTGTITLAASTTLVSDGTKLATRYTGASAYHRGSNVWLAMGKLTT